MIRLRIRGYAGAALLFKEDIDAEEVAMESLVEEHMKLLLPHPTHMLEFEFLDELDPKQRYFRFGTDTRRMRNPIGFDLTRFKP